MRLDTRVKEKVDAVDGAELRCTGCDTWKSPDSFHIKRAQPGPHSSNEGYQARCASCTNAERNFVRREGVSSSEARVKLREALGTPNTNFAGALNQARHPQRSSTPLPEAEKRTIRERREADAGRPDLCYLVGMQGDDSAVKIGHSTNPWARLGEYQAGNPRKLEVIAVLDGGQAKEREFHHKFHIYHGDNIGEWFNKSPEIMNHFAAGRVSA